jgi:hypothetical protein
LDYRPSLLYRAYCSKERIPLDDIFAMIEIGRKYEIQHIFKEGMSRVRAEFPNTLWELSQFESQAGRLGIDYEEAEGTDVLFHIVTFCTAHSDTEELISVLPIAYYWPDLRSIVSVRSIFSCSQFTQ